MANISQIKVSSTTYDIAAPVVSVLTSAPTSAFTAGGYKIVILSAEPATRYAGYIYIITG